MQIDNQFSNLRSYMPPLACHSEGQSSAFRVETAENPTIECSRRELILIFIIAMELGAIVTEVWYETSALLSRGAQTVQAKE